MLHLFDRFRADRRGNVALTFGLAVLPLTMAVGMGIDITNATRTRLALQDATDTAALALVRQASTVPSGQAAATAQNYVQASFSSKAPLTVTSATIDRQTITAEIETRADVPVYFSKLFGVSTIPVTSRSVAQGMQDEIALVLDTSGSMSQSAGTGGPKITALKDAADSFLDTLFGDNLTTSRVAVSITPFAASVNVGSANRNASWIDGSGKSSLAAEDFSGGGKTRFNLFDEMNTAWGGCVISRPSAKDYDITDTAPNPSDGDSLFVPWFAPDEPDTGSGFTNNYIPDAGGNCGSQSSQILASPGLRQSNTCKYMNATPKAGLGPNVLCDSQPITALSSNHSALTTAVGALKAKGNTNILEGFMWGWRSLSPGAPFGGGRPYNTPNNRKVIVLMTDGQNNFGTVNNADMSRYSSFGYAVRGRIAPPTTDNNALDAAMDGRTQKACANAKAQGLIIYTIAFGADAAGSKSLLQGCASDPTYFYAPQNSSDLKPVFLKIAESIKALRIAQ